MRSNPKAGRSTLIAVAAIAILAIVAVVVVMRATAPPPRPGEVNLYCDASMRAVMNEIIERFQRRSDVRVHAHFAPSNTLLAELEAEPEAADLFLPGDRSYLEEAQAAGLVAETAPVAWGVPVILTQAGNPQGIESVEDLARSDLRLAIADAAESATGRITPMIFEQHGLSMDEVEPNVVFTAETEMEVGNAIRLGRADAAIIWLPVAQNLVRVEIVPIPIEKNVIAELTIGLTSNAASPSAAREFMEFLGRRGAQARLEDHRYALSPPEPGDPRFETAAGVSADPEEPEQWAAIDLYWVEVVDGEERVTPVSRDIELEHGVIEDAVRVLLEGPNVDEDLEGYSSSIPEETELLSFEHVGGVVTVDFSSDLDPSGGSAWITAIQEQITNTLLQFDEVEEVVILVEGEEDALQP